MAWTSHHHSQTAATPWRLQQLERGRRARAGNEVASPPPTSKPWAVWIHSNDGVRIDYEVVGNGRPLILLHGFFGDRTTWHAASYVNALADQARLILIDARGHGHSGAPHDAASYRVAQQVADVLAVLDALGIERAAVWGSSMGGTIGLHLLATHPKRVSGLIATGAHADRVIVTRDELEQETRTLRTAGVGPFLAHLERQGPVPDWMRAAMLAADPHALAALTVALAERHSVVEPLTLVQTPVLLLAGDRDPHLDRIRRTAAQLPRSTLVEFSDCGHFDAFARTDLAVPPARKFLLAPA
jgi:pimeloyl-ACP methyl ester carboxylesterase